MFSAALSSLPEMAHVVTIDTRYVGEAALAAGNRDVFVMIVKFMNTYLRAALNARDVRTAYNVLNQYRQLAEALLAAPEDVDRWSSTTLVEVAAHFKYYARLAHGNGMGFVTETAAYDLCALCEVASVHQSDCQDRLLQIFLQIDDAPETPDEERALRGVRKAQAKLASYYLSTGESARAQAIFDDMAAESPERLRSIRDEMLAVTAKDFWEVVDRGANFDYLPEPRKERLRQFFAQFPALGGGRPPGANLSRQHWPCFFPYTLHDPPPDGPGLGRVPAWPSCSRCLWAARAARHRVAGRPALARAAREVRLRRQQGPLGPPTPVVAPGARWPAPARADPALARAA